MRRSVCLLLLLGCAGEPIAAEDPAPRATLALRASSAGAATLLWNDAPLGQLRGDGDAWALRGDDVEARFARALEPLTADAYPRRVRIRGALAGSDAAFEQSYTQLAPPSPLWIEGLGLEVADDVPGMNRTEHAALRAWLTEQGLTADTAPFEALHRADAGRELHVWYEISGRRVEGALRALAADEVVAEFDSLFRTEDGGLKIHHQRPGENGRFTYHRKSLELADVFTDPSGAHPPLHAHECGCYGYGIAADLMTLGSQLYRVEADWLDDRVAAEFFLGLERRPDFPWLALGDRRRMRDLARRIRAYDLKDAEGEPFAQVSLDLPSDPPSPDLGPITYRFDRFIDGRRVPLARAAHTAAGIEIALYGEADARALLEQLDTLLAAIPTQIQRGDGVRDSHLAEIERVVDYARLLQQPDAARLADVVSDVDAASVHAKVAALLAGTQGAFLVDAEALPPAPSRGGTRVGAR